MDTTNSSRQPSRQVTIDERNAGQRVDNFLCLHLKGVPKAHIYRILRRGEVRVNRGRVKQGYRLCPGDVVRVPPLRYEHSPRAYQPGSRLLALLKSSIIYEDAGLLVVDKPPGVAVHGGARDPLGLIEGLRHLRPAARFLELVHRLDRDTSGCLLVAKRRSVLRYLHRCLRERKVDKRYLTLVMGRWQGGTRRVNTALRRDRLRSGERVVRPDEDGKTAVTLLRPVVRSELASLLEVKTMTGRTHQIRVHAGAVGCPIAGDEKYGDRQFNRSMREMGLKRIFLHASSIAFPDEETDQEVRLTAPLPGDLAAVLGRLGLAVARQRVG